MKNIVLFSDGTGNSSAKAQKTNVWRLFQALDQTTPAQIARYDDGVGTSSNKYLAAIGGAFGWGLKRNVLNLYKFVCLNYDADDRIYGFGFSRGAFTIRVLLDLIATEGLVIAHSDEELTRNAAAAYRHYRAARFPSRSPFVFVMRWLRDGLIWAKDRIKGYHSYNKIKELTTSAGRANIPIRFIGLWDTVDAYGMPIAGLKRGIDLVLWPMLFGDTTLSPRVQQACHALSLDDERTTFHPVLWDEVAEADLIARGQVPAGRLAQVWFAGVHSNVGGGYPEDQLSLVSLEWMMAEAIAAGLSLDELAVAQVCAAKSPYARIYDSRAGFGCYYHYGPRQIWVAKDKDDYRILPIIHGSVVMRMAYGSDHYSPISLPNEFWVLAPDGTLLPMEGAPLSLKLDETKRVALIARPTLNTDDAAITREKAQLTEAIRQLESPDREFICFVWDTVFWRNCLYVVTVVATLLLIAYPWLGDLLSSSVRWIVERIPFIGSGLASTIHDWSSQIDNGSRGPISNLTDALSGLIPRYAEGWTEGLKEHSLEMGLIMLTIVGCILGSNILKGRIHDRSRLAWHRSFRKPYAEWYKQSQKGWRNGVAVALIVTVAYMVWSRIHSPSETMLFAELAILTGVLTALLGIRMVGRRPTSQSGTATDPIEGTFAMAVARWLRENAYLRSISRLAFKRVVPITFALLLVVAGWLIVNQALYEAFNAAGLFCKGSVMGDARKTERIGLSDRTFQTDSMCWASGLVLVTGRHYRITITTRQPWFDRTMRADVGGFPANNFALFTATPLKRAWTANWFNPIARIDEIGNDEYVLGPEDGFEPHTYPACQLPDPAHGRGIRGKITGPAAERALSCAPTPDSRKVLTTEIKARTTGELFLYVNDAVIMWPGSADLFVSNNTGSATVSVEREFAK